MKTSNTTMSQDHSPTSQMSTATLKETEVKTDFGLYQGNSLFRNQPSYNVFCKSIELPDDTLYMYLNEVDAEILKNEQTEPSDIFSSYSRNLILKDPRTKEFVSENIRDYSSNGIETSTFSFPNIHDQECNSTLNLQQHAACLRVLQAWQQSLPLPEDDFIIWKATEKKRCTEQQVVQKYIYDYSQNQKEIMYKPMRSLVKAYQKWLQSRIEEVLKKRKSDELWVTHTGLPQLSQCKSLQLNEQIEAKVEKVHLKKIDGDLRYWPQEVKLEKQQMRSLNIRMDRYATATAMKDRVLNIMDDDWDGTHFFVLPLDSLLMILTPTAAYVDLPTEMFINIKETAEHKCIEFDTPLPARHCGWHTNNFIVTQAYETYISQPGQAQWIQMGDIAKQEIEESHSYTGDYEIHEIDTDYSSRIKTKTNEALISWCLSMSPSCSTQILTQMSLSGSKDKQGKHLLGCHLLKLENKPDCGFEIMTKYELIKIWLQMQLLQTDRGHCSRLALVNLEPLLEEELTLSSVEQHLHEYYNTNVNQLLANLYEFLKLFNDLPPDEYLIRYLPKYKDKFLLCRKTQEVTPQSLSLRDLLGKESSLPSEHCFLTQGNSYLPISTKLCGPLHLINKMLPCAFPPKSNGKYVKQRTIVKSKTTARLETPMEKRRAEALLRRKKQKSQQKARSRARKREAAKKEVEEQNNLDKIMYL